MKPLKLVTTMLFLLAMSSQGEASKVRDADSIIGVWESGEGTGHIAIYKKGNKYYGKIVWLQEPLESDGSPKKDINNPDEKLQNRTIKGLEILRGFQYDGDNEWIDGQIYDPENGNDYSCKMTLRNDGKLEVRGYIGISLFGRTDVWTRQK